MTGSLPSLTHTSDSSSPEQYFTFSHEDTYPLLCRPLTQPTLCSWGLAFLHLAKLPVICKLGDLTLYSLRPEGFQRLFFLLYFKALGQISVTRFEGLVYSPKGLQVSWACFSHYRKPHHLRSGFHCVQYPGRPYTHAGLSSQIDYKQEASLQLLHCSSSAEICPLNIYKTRLKKRMNSKDRN